MKCKSCIKGALINAKEHLYSCTEKGGLREMGESYRNYQNRSMVKAIEHEYCENYISRDDYKSKISKEG